MSTRRRHDSEYHRRRNRTPDPWAVERQRQAAAEQSEPQKRDAVNADAANESQQADQPEQPE
jgi:hypothetical protein